MIHHRAKLSDEAVRAMREFYARVKKVNPRIGYRQIGQRFQCGASTVRDIVKGRTRASV